jgi:hypothetical protein
MAENKGSLALLHGSPMSLNELTQTDLTRPDLSQRNKIKTVIITISQRLYSFICE